MAVLTIQTLLSGNGYQIDDAAPILLESFHTTPNYLYLLNAIIFGIISTVITKLSDGCINKISICDLSGE